MIAKVNGQRVFLSDGEAPQFSLSANSVEDPSKIKGNKSTTIRILNTPEAARVLGTEHMINEAPSVRPTIVIGDGAGEFRSRIVPVRADRDVIECLAVGGNAGWFEFAKATKLRDLDLGVSPTCTAAHKASTWTDADELACFPLVEYGAYEDAAFLVGRRNLRPAIRIHALLNQALASAGYQVQAVGALADDWKKFILLASADAMEEALSSSRTDAFVGVGTVVCATAAADQTPGWFRMSTGTSNWVPGADANEQHFLVPYSTRVLASIVDLTIVSPPSALNGTVLEIVVFDKKDQSEITRIVTGTLSTGVDYTINAQFPEFFIEEGAKLDIGFRNETGSPVNITLQTPGISGYVRYEPQYQPFDCYASGPASQLIINTACPDITVADAINIIGTALCLVFDTDDVDRIIRVSYDADYFKVPTRSIEVRDWTRRIDHTNGPAKITNGSPERVSFRYADDTSDRLLKSNNARLQPDAYAGADVEIGGAEKAVTISVPASATAMRTTLGGLFIPCIRKVGTYQEANYDHAVRVLIMDGVYATNAPWNYEGVDQTTYPRCYFTFPDDTLPQLHFGNGSPFAQMPEGTAATNWRGRLARLGSKRLEAYFIIHDHELQRFDFGMPTLVDDGSGPRFYYVQEIVGHRFGTGEPTKCVLVEIPGPEVNASPMVSPAATYPSQPFACVGEGYASMVAIGSPAPHVRTTTGYLATRKASNGLIQVFGTGGSGEFQPNPDGGDTYCLWPCDALGNLSGEVTTLRAGDDSGVISSMDLSGWTAITSINFTESLNLESLTLGSKPVLDDLSIEETQVASIDLSGCDALTTFIAANVPELETVIPPPNVTLEVVNVPFCGLDTDSVNGLALACDPDVAGSFDSSSGTNAAPTGAAVTYLLSLMSTPFTISGAGEGAVNGEYTPNGTILGHESYINGGGITIYFAGFGGWIITDGVNTYYTTEAPDDPWDVVTWQTDGGFAAPAPTLTAPGGGLWTVNTN